MVALSVRRRFAPTHKFDVLLRGKSFDLKNGSVHLRANNSEHRISGWFGQRSGNNVFVFICTRVGATKISPGRGISAYLLCGFMS